MYRLILIVWICVCCSCHSQHERRLEYALGQAGDNRAELEKVLEHYADDSLKLEAAKFLIRNMVYHTGFYDTLVDTKGKEYMPDISYPEHNDEQVMYAFDSLLQCGYKVHSVKKRDIETVNADFLIDNIECAFEIWSKPWARTLSFENFCQYVLPYRTANEPLSPLRREIQDKYLAMLDSVKIAEPEDLYRALVGYLNDSLAYVGTMPLYSSIEMVDKYRRSNCEGIAVYTSFVMRALGIPFALDCTTWAKSEDGHCWGVVLKKEGEWQVFSLYGLDSGQHKVLFSKRKKLIPPKVYRRMFMPEPTDMEMDDDGYRTYVKNPLFKDVTETYYTPPVDVVMELPEGVEERTAYVYLCASAVNHFRVLAVGTRTGRKCVVKNVVGDNTFILADSPDGKNLRFLTDTFYVDSIGHIRK